MTKHQALIVDDEADIRELLHITLDQLGLKVWEAESVQQAITLLDSHQFDLCLTDMRMPGGDGMTLVDHIQRR